MTRGTSRRPLAIAGLALTMTAALSVGVVAQDQTVPTRTQSSLTSVRTPRRVRRTRRSSRCSRATEAGAGIQFEESYGASGDQSRAVVEGLPADVVALSL